MATTVNTRPPIIPDNTITVGTVAEKKKKIYKVCIDTIYRLGLLWQLLILK